MLIYCFTEANRLKECFSAASFSRRVPREAPVAMTDFIAAHFGDDHASLAAFLALQEAELREVADAELAAELAEAALLDATGLSDLQLAARLAAEEEVRWLQVEHDRDFAQELRQCPEDEWHRNGDNLKEEVRCCIALPNDTYVKIESHVFLIFVIGADAAEICKLKRTVD